MTNILLPKLTYIVFLIFLSYFLILTVFYLFLAVVGFLEGKKRRQESEEENYPLAYLSTMAIPVSIIVPAHNEEEWIRDSLLSILNQNYPKFEVIVVDDDSTDGTFDILNGMLGLRPVYIPYIKHYKDGKVREIFKGEIYPNVTVIRKVTGTKKAGAVNAGLNLAKNDYVCVIDADTVLEPDSLLKVMAQVERYPENIIGIGSYFGLANGLKVKDGRIIERSFSYNPLVAYQNLEYIRSFIGNRIAWSKYNATPNVAGGFGIWRRDVLYETGGYSIDFTCEDVELTFRSHDYVVQNKEKNYRIVMLPYYVGWTEGPSTVPALISQRNRWQRVINETIWKYKYMLFNPRYGAFAFLTIPYFLFYEVLGVFFEVLSIAFVVAGRLAGLLDIKTFIAFLALMLLSQALISLLALFSFIRNQRIFRLSYICYLIMLTFLEFFCYRWIISIAKLLGTFDYFRGVKAYDQYKRQKRAA